jgi:hypothetical protein
MANTPGNGVHKQRVFSLLKSEISNRRASLCVFSSLLEDDVVARDVRCFECLVR